MPKRSAQEPIEFIARGVLLHRGDVLVCRNRKHGHLYLPGGHIEVGEPARVALEREIDEELGVHLQATRFLGACESTFHETRPAKGKRKPVTHDVHEINLVFMLESPTDKRIDYRTLASQEAKIEFLWVRRADLAKGRPGELLPRPMLRLVPRTSRSAFIPDLVTDIDGV